MSDYSNSSTPQKQLFQHSFSALVMKPNSNFASEVFPNHLFDHFLKIHMKAAQLHAYLQKHPT